MSKPTIDLEDEFRRRGIRVSQMGAPATQVQIEEVERKLSQRLPRPLREMYETLNGFRGPGNIAFLWPLTGEHGLLSYNTFVRKESWSPSWIDNAIFFGDDGSGSYWGFDVRASERVIEWEPFDGEEFSIAGPSMLDVWERRQKEYDINTRGRP